MPRFLAVYTMKPEDFARFPPPLESGTGMPSMPRHPQMDRMGRGNARGDRQSRRHGGKTTPV